MMSPKALHEYPGNPRLNDDAVGPVAESLKAYGWKQPIVVDADHVVIVGHTRLKAALYLGMDSVPVLVARDLTPDQARGYRLADNKTSDFSIWDDRKLLEELEALAGLDLFTGFTESEPLNELHLDDLLGGDGPVADEPLKHQLTVTSADLARLNMIQDAIAPLLGDGDTVAVL